MISAFAMNILIQNKAYGEGFPISMVFLWPFLLPTSSLKVCLLLIIVRYWSTLRSEGVFDFNFVCPAGSFKANPVTIFREVLLCVGRVLKFTSTTTHCKGWTIHNEYVPLHRTDQTSTFCFIKYYCLETGFWVLIWIFLVKRNFGIKELFAVFQSRKDLSNMKMQFPF